VNNLGLSPGVSFFEGVKVTKQKGFVSLMSPVNASNKMTGSAKEGWFILTNLDSQNSDSLL